MVYTLKPKRINKEKELRKNKKIDKLNIKLAKIEEEIKNLRIKILNNEGLKND
jgi:hypothetical protein